MKNLKNKIEGIIFISDAPVKPKEIAEFLKEDLIKVKGSIQELLAEWENKESSIKIPTQLLTPPPKLKFMLSDSNSPHFPVEIPVLAY